MSETKASKFAEQWLAEEVERRWQRMMSPSAPETWQIEARLAVASRLLAAMIVARWKPTDELVECAVKMARQLEQQVLRAES